MSNPFCETSIEFIGRERLIGLPDELSARKVLLLATQSAVTRFKLQPLVSGLIAQCEARWFYECAANPDATDVRKALASINGFVPDCIIALGGGSVIDLAKSVAALGYLADSENLSNDLIMRAIAEKDYLKTGSFPDIIAIPTTAGTGSELTQWATVWDRGNAKHSIDARGLKPKRALMCPELTCYMPEMLTLSTGLDCVCHAMEAYWSRYTTPLVQELSKQSLRLSVEYLKHTLITPDDLLGREYLLRASTLSALTFSQTRTTACHSISYPLTFLFGVEHGLAAAMTLGTMYDINKQAMPRPSEIDELFSGFSGIQGWLDYVCEGVVQLRLSAFGISSEDIDMIVSKAFTTGRMENNPVDLSEWDVECILREVLS